MLTNVNILNVPHKHLLTYNLHSRAGKLMIPFYQPNDPTATERENKKWRDAAGYDLAENLVFQLKDESLQDLIKAHAKSWHISAVWGFHIREADRGDGKYPWTSLETKLDNVVRDRFTPVRRVTLPGVPAAGLAAYSFDCVGRLIRRYTPQNDGRSGLGIHGPKLGRRPRFAALALPIPTPAQDARRTMERFRESVRDDFFSQLDAGPTTRKFLAERLAHARTMVTIGARLNDALAYRSGPCKLTPADVGNLLGSIEYFSRCWEDFHKAEKPTAPLPGELTALIPGLTHCRPGYIDTVLDNALAERKTASDNAADWFKFIDLVSYNAEKLPLDPERRAWVMRWASGAKSDLNRLLSGPQVPIAEQTDRAALTARLQHLTGTTRRVLARADATLTGCDPANVARNEEEISSIEQRLNELEKLQPLNTPAPSDAGAVDGVATEWEDLLQKAAKDFTLVKLDALLAKLKELNDEASPKLKGGALVGVIKALRELQYLVPSPNYTVLARILAKRYGKDMAGPHSVGREPVEPLAKSAQYYYTRTLALQPAL